jgi:hypothetical protein
MKEDWMKKLLTILLALAAFGGFAFAEDAAPALVLSGSVETGFQIDGTAADMLLKIWDSDQGGPSSVTIDGVLSGKAAGAKFELKVRDLDTEAVNCGTLYAWWKPIDMLTVSAGSGYGVAWTTPYNGNGDGGTGFQVKIAPFDGLVASLDYAFEKVTPAAFAAGKFIATAGYTLTDIASLGFDADFGADSYWVGASLLAVKDLTVQVEAKILYPSFGMKIEEYFAYVIAGATPYLYLYQDTTSAFAWGAKVGASYPVAGITPAFYVKYNSDATYAFGLNADYSIEKLTLHPYFDYNSDTTWDLGLRFKVAF